MMRSLPSLAVAGSAAVSKRVAMGISRMPRAAINLQNREYFIRGLSIFQVELQSGFAAITRTSRPVRQNKIGAQAQAASARRLILEQSGVMSGYEHGYRCYLQRAIQS